MQFNTVVQNFRFGNFELQAHVPDILQLQQWYIQEKEKNPATEIPYWGQVWPAAHALCHFIADQPALFQNKSVLELAAGLGLPSLLCGRFAKDVCCSDVEAEAIAVTERSINHLGLQNISCCILNWNNIPTGLNADVLLLSDINYEPASFETLCNVINRFLNTGTTVVLSTPQRLMAKPFIERLLPFCVLQQELAVTGISPSVLCTIMVLQKVL